MPEITQLGAFFIHSFLQAIWPGSKSGNAEQHNRCSIQEKPSTFYVPDINLRTGDTPKKNLDLMELLICKEEIYQTTIGKKCN